MKYKKPAYASNIAPLAICSWCEKEFSIANQCQLGALNSGRNVYCSKQCRTAKCNSALTHILGPCPTCGKMFRSRTKSKKFCCMDCYVQDPQTKERLRLYNEAKKTAPHACPNCGKMFSHKSKKYCSDKCRRAYYVSRFDRFVANPEQLSLPQCFDEFLSKSVLPCLVVGCDWEGSHLAHHCNVAHGIPKDQLKEMAGFNKTTGLVPPDERHAMSERFKKMMADGVISAIGFGSTPPSRSYGSARPEAIEHAKKARAIINAEGKTKRDIPCRSCGNPVSQPIMGKKLYCSTVCRSRFYNRNGVGSLRCSFCGNEFEANRVQINRARKGGNTCCSIECRNKMNMVACLAARGIKWKP